MGQIDRYKMIIRFANQSILEKIPAMKTDVIVTVTKPPTIIDGNPT